MSSGLEQLITESKKKERTRPYLIGISGGSGGGKTSVANLIYKSLTSFNSVLFSMDTYYKDLTPEQEKNLSNYNFDSPEALDLDLLYEHLNDLMHWKKIKMPTYDFATNKRQKDTLTIEPAKVIIFEGILAFYDERMRNLMDLKLFIDLDDDIRLSRRIYRDIIFRGRKMETVLERYHKFVKTAYNNFIKPTKEHADIIIPRGGSNTVAIDLINYHLKYLVANVTFRNDKGEIMEKVYISEKKTKDHYMKQWRSDAPEIIEALDVNDVFSEHEDRRLVKKEEEGMFLDIFKNIIKRQNTEYFDLYMDMLTQKIKEAYQKDDLVIFSSDDITKVDSLIKERIKKLKEDEQTFNVFYFLPISQVIDQTRKKIIKFLKETEEIDTIKIVAVFVDTYWCLDDFPDYKIDLKAIYSGKKVSSYNYIFRDYNYYEKKDDENSYNSISLSDDNFERRLLELIEADNKKDNLSIINNEEE